MVCLPLGRSTPRPAEHSSSPAAHPCAPATLQSHELAVRDGFALQDETQVCPQVLLLETGGTVGFLNCLSRATTVLFHSSFLIGYDAAPSPTRYKGVSFYIGPSTAATKPATSRTNVGPARPVSTIRLRTTSLAPSHSLPGPADGPVREDGTTTRLLETLHQPTLDVVLARGRRGLGTACSLEHRYAQRSHGTGHLRNPPAGRFFPSPSAHSEARNSF